MPAGNMGFHLKRGLNLPNAHHRCERIGNQFDQLPSALLLVHHSYLPKSRKALQKVREVRSPSVIQVVCLDNGHEEASFTDTHSANLANTIESRGQRNTCSGGRMASDLLSRRSKRGVLLLPSRKDTRSFPLSERT